MNTPLSSFLSQSRVLQSQSVWMTSETVAAPCPGLRCPTWTITQPSASETTESKRCVTPQALPVTSAATVATRIS